MTSGPGQPPTYSQSNQSNSGNVYAHQGSGNLNIHTGPPPQRGPRTDTKVLLAVWLLNIGFFFYGMFAYTGTNNSADEWRAGIYLFLLVVALRMTRRWFRRR